MGRGRRLLEGALSKLDEVNERKQAADVAKLTPAERERYDAWVARTEAARAGTPVEELGDARLLGKVLQGPAGEVVHGVVKAAKQRAAIEDPAAWERQRLAELADRDATRAPYLSPGRHPVAITRLATRGKPREVAGQLASSGLAGRPELVYGAYRVPDMISPGRLGGEALVEWDVVHAAEGPLPPADVPSVLTLDARDVLVVRAAGERRPLDEDLALDVLAGASVGPERTLAIARDISIQHLGGSDGDSGTSRLEARVRGVHVLVAGAAPAAGGPRELAEGAPDGVCVDVLQWDALAQAVHPVRPQRAPLPSPFPYLPLTPQELLRAYLEIVGVSPADAYSAQVTYDRPFDLMGRGSGHWAVRRTGGGPDLPCADGKPRKRMAGGHHIVVAYRDRPQYEAGRGRFDAYAERELQVHLRRGLGLREPVPKPPGRLERTVDRVGGVIEFFTMEPGAEDGFVAPRYCWPPR